MRGTAQNKVAADSLTANHQALTSILMLARLNSRNHAPTTTCEIRRQEELIEMLALPR